MLRKIHSNTQRIVSGLMMENSLVQRNYTAFVILTPGRSGSTMLIDCLNQNGHIHCQYEVFNRKGVENNPWRRYLKNNTPIRYLNWIIYQNFPKQIQAVGFSLHYYHCQQGRQGQIWEYLAYNNSIKILHLTRNPLHVYLSSQLARRSGIWHVKSGDDLNDLEQVSLKIEVEACQNYFLEFDDFNSRYQKMFQKHDVLEVCYEQLTANINQEVAKIQRWLGVSPEAVEPRYKKLNQRPIAQVISNYQELNLHFKDSSWSKYFIE